MKKNNLKKLINRILNEELEKRVPEQGDKKEDSNKTFASDPNSRDVKTKDELWDELSEAVKKINSSYTVVWDDHDDLMINGRDLVFIRIVPKWENKFDVVIMIRNEDRIKYIGFTWEKVMKLVKDKLSKIKHTGVEKARDKSWRNSQDQDKGPSTKNPEKNKVKIKKPEDMETMNKEEDNPDQYLREVDDIKKQSDYKVSKPVRIRKKYDNSKHVVKMN